MQYWAVYLVAFLASLLGPLCGIGGGVIIKPVVDAMGVMPVATVSFLSGVSVLTMSLATLIQNAVARTSCVDAKSMLPLALGSSIGGVGGKIAFNYLTAALPNTELVGAVQAILLIALSALVFAYTIHKASIEGMCISSSISKALIGVLVGACWSFLGIGGGPFNLAILAYFFSIPTKEGAQSSLFIIAFSQGASLLYSLALGGLPSFEATTLVGVCMAAVVGSVAGRRIAKRISSTSMDRLYLFSLVLIACICTYNFVRFIT